LITGRFDDAIVDNLQDLSDGNFHRRPSKKVTAMDTATAGDHATTAKFEQDLFEVLDGNFLARGDLMNGDDFGVFHRQMEDCAGRVFAFGRYSHAFRRVDFHTGTPVSIVENAFKRAYWRVPTDWWRLTSMGNRQMKRNAN